MQRASSMPVYRVVPANDKGVHPAKVQSVETYDQETGQVYSEREVVFRKRQNSDWIGEYKTPRIATQTRSDSQGSRSLFELAKTKCAKQFRSFSVDHFEIVPWPLADKLWDEIVATHTESFHAWRTLATVYNTVEEFGNPAHRYHIEIKQPPMPAKEYYKGLTSSNTRWLTALRISPRQVSIPDLVAISTITNIAVLDLSDGQLHVESRPPLFDERVMRTFAELAASGKAFQHLRAIFLGWQDTVAEWIFKYLDLFPSLCLLVTTDCKMLHQKNRAQWEATAVAHGWEAPHAKKSVKILRPLLDDPNFYRCAISNTYYRSQNLYQDIFGDSMSQEIGTLPLVECWLGSPRSWTHIIDEFPSTRTIWFEKIGTKANKDIGPTENSKRVRESVTSSPTMASPPPKRSQNHANDKRRPPKQDLADLLADFDGRR